MTQCKQNLNTFKLINVVCSFTEVSDFYDIHLESEPDRNSGTQVSLYFSLIRTIRVTMHTKPVMTNFEYLYLKND